MPYLELTHPSKRKKPSTYVKKLFDVENAGFNPNPPQLIDFKSNNYFKRLITDKLRTIIFPSIFGEMELQYKKKVELKTGKKELSDEDKVNEDWFIEYHILENNRWKRYKFRHDLNSNDMCKTFSGKKEYGEALLVFVKDLLSKGTAPHQLKSDKNRAEGLIDFTVEEKIPLYLEHKAPHTRTKTLSSYKSKLNYFKGTFGQSKIKQITTESVQIWIDTIAKKLSWSNTTYNQTRIILYGFFDYLKSFGNIKANPIEKVKTRKKLTASNQHKPFSEDTFREILNYLDKKDTTTALFVRLIYYTCVRPKEIRQLTVGHFDIKKKTLHVPETISKNKKSSYLPLHNDLLKHLVQHGIKFQTPDTLLFGTDGTVFSKNKIGENTIYERFRKVLKALDINKDGYTLYSVKHTSNIIRYRNGWTVAQIMKANRHSSITETENYLRGLGEFIDINKDMPSF